MDFLMEDQIIFNTSARFEGIYTHISSKCEIKYHELLLVCASIGFKNNRKTSFKERGKETRSNFFNANQRSIAYSIILADPELGKNIEQFEEADFRRKARKLLEEYAEGGMEILVEEVFGNRWDGHNLDPTYHEYEVDILSYIYSDMQEIPF